MHSKRRSPAQWQRSSSLRVGQSMSCGAGCNSCGQHSPCRSLRTMQMSLWDARNVRKALVRSSTTVDRLRGGQDGGVEHY